MSEECHAADGYSGSLLRPQVTNSCPCCNENTRLLAAATARIAELERERDEAVASSASFMLSFRALTDTNEQTFQNWRKSVATAEKFRNHMRGHTAECSECAVLVRAAQQPRQTPGGGVK